MRKSLRSAVLRQMCRLRFKCATVLALVVVIATALSAAIYVRVSARLVMDQASSRARDVAMSLAAAAAAPIVAQDQAALLAIAQVLIPRGEVGYVAFADPAGRVLAGAQEGEGQLSMLLRDDGRTIPITPLDAAMLVEDNRGAPRLDLTYPVFPPGAAVRDSESPPVVGFVRIGLLLADADARLAELTDRVILVAVLISLLMVPIGFGLVNHVVRPLNQLGEAARAFARGQYGQRVDNARRDELGDLARAFNAMADDLARSHHDLVRLNSELEDRVLSRTFQLSEVNRRLQDEVAEKEDFLRAVSHDLSAPLRNIAGMAAMVRSRHAGCLEPTAIDLLQRMEHSVRHELELIDELLELSRIRTRREKLEAVDLDREVRAVASQFEYELKSKAIRLEIESRLPVIWAEKLRIRQLWQNLIDNAVKYTDPARVPPGRSPTIRIMYQELGEDLEFRIADRGIGIAPRDRSRVFYVFRRAKDGYVARTSGKGVGLASCKSIVHSHGGRIWIESNPGGGSVFCFTLARRKPAPAPPGEPGLIGGELQPAGSAA